MNRLLEKLVALCTPERVRRYPATITVVFFVVWLGGFIHGRQGGVLDAFGKFLGNDFVAFYTGGRFFLDGRMDELYAMRAQYVFQQSLTTAQLAQTSPFINPPFAVVWYAPFAAMPYLWGLLLWWAVGVASIVLSAWIVHRTTPGLEDRPRWHLLAVAACAPPTLLWLGYGQATPLILLLLSAVYGLVSRQRWVLGAVALGMLAFKPQLALGWALMMAMRRRWAALATGAMVLGAWLGVGWMISSEAMRVWWGMRGELMEMLRAPGYPGWGVCSIYGFFNGLIHPYSPALADVCTLVVSAVGVMALAWLWRRDVSEDARAFHAKVAITLMCAPLLAMQYYTYDLMLGVLPLWIVMGLCRGERREGYLDEGAVLGWTVVLFLGTFLLPPLLAAQLDAMRAHGMRLVYVQPIPLLVLGWSVAVYRAVIIPARESVVISREDH